MTLVQSLDTSLIRDVNRSHGMFSKVNHFASVVRMAVLSHLKLIEYYADEYDIIFFVDDYTYPILKDIFPDTVKKFSDYMPLNETNIWTQSKINCFKFVKAPFLHIDSDIIFKKKICLKEAENSEIYVERIEDRYTFNWYTNGIRYMDEAYGIYRSKDWCDLNRAVEYWRPDLKFAYNCGLFGFNSEDAKNKYVEFYNELENLYSWRLLFEPYYEQIFVVLEQYALNCFAIKENLTVKYLLEGTSLDEQSKIADKVGYVHLFGVAKYLEVNIKKIAGILESEYLHIYNKLETLK